MFRDITKEPANYSKFNVYLNNNKYPNINHILQNLVSIIV